MAHTKVIERKERLMDQLGKGYRTRYVKSLPFIVAQARGAQDATNEPVADCIKAQTRILGMFMAPVNCTVNRIFVNAQQYPTMAANHVHVTLSKAVIAGADVDLCSALTISGLTAYTDYDAVLVATAGVCDLLEGQLVYVTLVVDNANVTAKSIAATVNVELYPTDK
jgi:hypothetical protein